MRRGILDSIGGALKTAGSNYMAMPRDQRFLMGAGMFTDGVAGMAQGYAAGADMADMAAQRKRRGILDTRADAEWEAAKAAEAQRQADIQALIASLPENQQAAGRIAPEVAAKQALAPEQAPIAIVPAGAIAMNRQTGEVVKENPRQFQPRAGTGGLPPLPTGRMPVIVSQ